MKVCDKKNRHYSSAIRENMLTEPYMMQKLDHPAIPKVVDIIEDEDSIFIVRDYIEGETLETVVRMHGAQPADKVIEWGKQMCSALGYLHSQNPPLIYRDMKPANVILKPDGSIKFIDLLCVLINQTRVVVHVVLEQKDMLLRSSLAVVRLMHALTFLD